MARHRKLTQKFAGFPIFKVGTSGDTFPVTSPFTLEFTGYGDGLSLDLQFAADKTLTARKGPTPTFTRGSTATFVGSNGLIQSAAINGPRFDHNPVTLACKGLLIEESRTNLVLQSENHPSATWNKTGVTVASATNTSPSGSTTSNLVSEDSSTGLHRISQSTTYVSGTSYSISVFLKYAGRQFVAITNPGVASNNIAIFDIQNGTISLTQSGVTTSITAYPNGWYRCVVNGVSATTGGASHIIQGSTTGGSLTGSYTGLNGPAFYIYGAQVEAGSFATSYIPTTTGSVVRSADVCDVVGADVHPSVGTLVVEFDRRSTNSALFRSPGRVLASASATGTDYAGIDHNDTQIRTPIRAANATVSALAFNNTSIGATKTAVAWASGDSAHVSGGVVRTSTSAAIAFTNPLDTISFCGISPNPICTTISSIRYYKKRLPNAKLQTLTA